MRGFVALIFAISFSPIGALAQPESQQLQQQRTQARYTVDETPVGILLDDPAAHAILQNRIPEIVGDWRIHMARNMTLKMVQSHAHGRLSDQTLALIEADFIAIAPVR